MDFIESHKDSFAELLREKDITPTHQRLEIARVLLACKQHLSADDILGLVNHHHAETSKATVYNTLKLFLEKGLIREVIVDPTRVFYDSNTAPHHHFFDVDHGALIDIDAERLTIAGLPELPEGMVATGVDVIVRIKKSPENQP
ncbi:MAG TPA: transcriptional repressor [Burkholderiales bacterium]|nr:transcriptional repressor [Burkholderiales bacterium]